MIEWIGWLGGILFAICALPQAIHIYRTKDTSSLSWIFLGTWFWGEVLCLTYVIVTNYNVGTWQIPLIFNYVFNLLTLIFIIGMKVKYDNENTTGNI